MGSSFLSPQKKRSSLYLHNFYSDISTVHPFSIIGATRITHMTDQPFSANGSSNRSKRPKPQYPYQQQPPPLIVPHGHVSFRLLCHASRIGGIIGKSGSVIKNLQQITGAKIRVEEAPADSPDRIVVVVAPSAVTTKVVLKDPNFGRGAGNNGSDGEVFEISKAQEALLKVFDRILEVAAETDGNVVGVGVVSCRLLAEAAQVGSVIGKGGKVVEKIRKDTGCKVRVLTDKLPACADSTDEMVEIEGNIFSVRMALVAVSCRLQDCLSGDKTRATGSKTLDAVPHDNMQNLHTDHLLLRNSLLTARPNISHMHGGGVTSSSVDFDRVATLDPKSVQLEVTYKILCSNDRVGCVIGKSGGIVKALQSETGATISIGPSVAECDEKLITITAHENPESRYSPAQKAVVLVFSRSSETGIEKGQDSGTNKGKSITARLVIPSNQVGCLLGRGGSIISDIRRVTGTSIWILGTDQAPKCVSEKDQVVLLSGEYSNVQDALYNVTGRLRDNFLLSVQNSTVSRSTPSMLDTTSYVGLRETASLTNQPSISVGVSRNLNRHSLGSSTNYLGHSHTPDEMPSLRPWTVAGMTSRGTNDVSRGSGLFKDGIELGSGSKSAIVTNTTVEILVPEDVIGCVYGDNGNNLARLRQISGAKVTVYEPLRGASDRTIIMSGTPDETRAAQSLLQAFILTGSS